MKCWLVACLCFPGCSLVGRREVALTVDVEKLVVWFHEGFELHLKKLKNKARSEQNFQI